MHTKAIHLMDILNNLSNFSFVVSAKIGKNITDMFNIELMPNIIENAGE